ncbi:NAD-dependent epimerase/dehydratase family protein [Actinoplanes sp. CA-051413]|uniref:NAD-dependent epimerase/dehydratase family protein n=1 Tax=Actinoplanes sp. CA-051413 TaxID=3239899 RepID=UPI003D959CF2
MKLLVLGGTGFVGPALIDEAQNRGHNVTVLNRGHQPPPPGTAGLTGDRLTPAGLTALTGGTWDLVVDTWSGRPSAVRDAARALDGRAGHYTYLSSRSVHADTDTPARTENDPLVDASPDSDDDGNYSAAKRGAELAAEQNFTGPVLHARAGLILGPRENIGRLPWWLNRLARGGPTLAPGPKDLKLQYIDARDLATWMLDAAEQGAAGPYNVVSPPGHTTMAELLETANEVTGNHADLHWADPQAILDAGIEPWMDLPIWLTGNDYAFMHGADVTKAQAMGLKIRPVRETIVDTWTWLQQIGGTAPQRPDRTPVGLDAAKEADFLKAMAKK